MKIIVLTGPPRIGKTRLALKMCEGKNHAFVFGCGKIRKILKDCNAKDIDLLVIDDISKNRLEEYEILFKEKYLTIILTTQYIPSWITKYKEAELWDETKIKEMIL